MGCLFALFSLFTPRLVLAILWLTGYLEVSFGSWFWPTVGFLVAPTTTIAYAVAKQDLSTGSGAITASGALVIVIGVAVDLGLVGGNARARRRKRRERRRAAWSGE
jgi:hypothetical protein